MAAAPLRPRGKTRIEGCERRLQGVRGDQGKTVVRIMTWEEQDTNDQIAAAMKPFEAENPTSSSRSTLYRYVDQVAE